jgi:hypothetical protein
MLFRNEVTGATFAACGSIVCGSVVLAQRKVSADFLYGDDGLPA